SPPAADPMLATSPQLATAPGRGRTHPTCHTHPYARASPGDGTAQRPAGPRRSSPQPITLDPPGINKSLISAYHRANLAGFGTLVGAFRRGFLTRFRLEREMKFKRNKLRNAIALSLAAGAVVLGGTGSALAQEATEQATPTSLDTVTVTGSRI